MEMLILDNRSETTDKLARYVRSLNIPTDVREPTQGFQVKSGSYRGVIISGGSLPRDGYKSILDWYRGFLHSTEIPVLGVCLGLRILGYCYGARVRRRERTEYGVTEINFHREYPLAVGRKILRVHEDHDYELISLPESLDNYASSTSCEIQAVKHKSKPQFGVQFHPEIDGGNEGHIVLENFAALCSK